MAKQLLVLAKSLYKIADVRSRSQQVAPLATVIIQR